MNLEKNPKTRPIYRKMLALLDRLGQPVFPTMPRPIQKDVYSCGPAVLTSLYAYLGVKSNQKAIIKSLRAKNKIKQYGLSTKDMERAAKAIGKGAFVFWKKSKSKVSDLDQIINKFNYPVGVEWQGVFHEFEDEDNGHYGIITQIDKKTGILRLSDPYVYFSGIDRKFDIKFFEKRWWDTNMIKGKSIKDNKVMFVITKKGETWPRKLGMKHG